jgi:hypothetical protein
MAKLENFHFDKSTKNGSINDVKATVDDQLPQEYII